MSSSTPYPLLELDSFDFTLDDFFDEDEIDAQSLPKAWDKRTGRPCINPLDTGSHVVNSGWIQNHWPCDKTTGKKLTWGTKGTHIVNSDWIKNHWPCDKKTGKRLAWGTTGTHVIAYQSMLKQWPHDKTTGKRLEWGTTGPNAVTYTWMQTNWPYNKETGEKIPWGSTGKHIISLQRMKDHWPHDKNTGEKLEWGATGEHVVSYYWIKSNWPYDKETGEKLEWGAQGPNVVNYSWRQNNWPHDRRTGEKLEWGTKGSNIITAQQRRKMKSRLIYAQDILAPNGHVLHKKGSRITPRTRVKKWGPGTLYIVGPQIDKPPKRKKALKTAVASKKKVRGAGAVASPVTMTSGRHSTFFSSQTNTVTSNTAPVTNASESISPTGTGLV